MSKDLHAAINLSFGAKSFKYGTADQDNRLYVRVSDALDRLDEIEVRYWVPRKFDKKDVDFHGTAIKAEIQYESKKRELNGDILEVGITKVATGHTVVIRGIDKLHKLKRKMISELHEGTASDVASKIGKAAGAKSVDAQGVSGGATEYVQANQTIASFLKAFAKENNYALRMEKDTLRFVRGDSAGDGEQIELDYDEIHDLKMNYSLNDVVSKVTVVGYDPKQAKSIKGVAAPKDLKKISGSKTAADIVQSKFGGVEWCIDNSNLSQTSQAEALAKGEIQRRAEQFGQGLLTTRLAPEARSGGKLKLKDAPWPLSGSFLIREVNHIWEDGRLYSEIAFITDSLP